MSDTATNNNGSRSQSRSSNALRLARHYERVKQNRVVLSVEVDVATLGRVLVRECFLNAGEVDNKPAVQKALQAYLDMLCRYFQP